MAYTIHKLIKQLQEFENKFLEVEVCDLDNGCTRKGIENIHKSVDKKILIFVQDKK